MHDIQCVYYNAYNTMQIIQCLEYKRQNTSYIGYNAYNTMIKIKMKYNVQNTYYNA